MHDTRLDAARDDLHGIRSMFRHVACAVRPWADRPFVDRMDARQGMAKLGDRHRTSLIAVLGSSFTSKFSFTSNQPYEVSH
jgi:hypothetical protein